MPRWMLSVVIGIGIGVGAGITPAMAGKNKTKSMFTDKKSHFSVKLCGAAFGAGSVLGVLVYNGDDKMPSDLGKSERHRMIVTEGDTKKSHCQVSSGKKRCQLSLVKLTEDLKWEAANWGPISSLIRVKDGRTVYLQSYTNGAYTVSTEACKGGSTETY